MSSLNMKVSVITPTVRKEGLDVIRRALQRQTFRDWEWLICSPFDPEISEAIWLKDDFTGGYWSLNRSYNLLLRNVSGDLVVSWQDNIWVPPDGILKFVENCPKLDCVISGVGDQYERLNKWGKPEIKIWSDPRKSEENMAKYGSFYEVFFNDSEWNWAAIPTKLFQAVGGFDEQLDFLGYGGDQLQVCERLNDLGVRFFIDQTNESFTVRHDRSKHGGQAHWDAHHVLFNGEYDKRKDELIQQGQWPKLNFLTEQPLVG